MYCCKKKSANFKYVHVHIPCAHFPPKMTSLAAFVSNWCASKLPIDFVYFAQNTIQENSFLPSVKNIRETGKSTRQITLGKKHVDKNYFPSVFRPELGILFAECIYASLNKKSDLTNNSTNGMPPVIGSKCISMHTATCQNICLVYFHTLTAQFKDISRVYYRIHGKM